MIRHNSFKKEDTMRILVTGVKGQLGYDIVEECKRRSITAIGVDIEEMDITNKTQV